MTAEQIKKQLETNYILYKKYSISLTNKIDAPDDVLQETMLYCLDNINKLASKLEEPSELNKYVYTIIQFSNYRKDERTNLSFYQNKYNKLKTTEISSSLKQLPNQSDFQLFEEKYKIIDELVKKFDKEGLFEKMIHSNDPQSIKKNNNKIYNKLVSNIKKELKNEN